MRLLSQYLCAYAVLMMGCYAMSFSYNLDSVDTYEHSRFFLKVPVVLFVAVIPITDVSKLAVVLDPKKEDDKKTVWSVLRKVSAKIFRGVYFVWRITFDCFESGEGIGITLLTMVICFLGMELYTGNTFQSTISYDGMIRPNLIFWNLFLYGLIHLVVYMVLRNRRWTSFVETLFFFIYGIINYFVILFRGNPVTLGDFSLIGTALSVADGYKYSVDLRFILTTAMMTAWLVFLIFLKKPKEKAPKTGVESEIKPSYIQRAVQYIVPLLCVWLAVASFGVFEIHVNFCYNLMGHIAWNTKLQSNYNGYLLSFIGDSGKTVIEPPANYDLRYLNAYMMDIRTNYDADTLNCGINMDLFDDKKENPAKLTEQQEPNIIVIMNESFSDLRVLGEIETDVDYMPYIRSLTEDTIYGNLYVSPFGGNTVFSEFEFLTGNSMAMLSTESIPYTQYLNTAIETPSLVSTLEAQEIPYSTVAIHPYSKSGYHRVDVYSSYGFDRFISVEDFPEYPIYRKFMQDEDNYKKMVEILQEKEDDQPMFIFNVTMQNHGGYGERTDYIYQNPVHVTNLQVYSGVDEYLSCIKDSDVAIQGLLEYLAEIDEPTIVLFFGDHQPGLASDFYDSVYRKPNDMLNYDEVAHKFIVPFFVWSNYEDYGGQYVEGISTNYLSSLLMQLADLEPTDYQKFLLKLHEEYPVISAISVVDESGVVMPHTNVIENENYHAYEMLEYNCIFEDDDRLNQYLFLESNEE